MTAAIIPLGQCHEPGCRRATRPGHSMCDDHRIAWMPEWRKRLTARDETGSLYPERGGAA